MVVHDAAYFVSHLLMCLQVWLKVYKIIKHHNYIVF